MAIFRASRTFPDDERFSLISQIRRSSRSVAANIAEAWRKRRYPASFVAKLSDAEAEAAETRAHLDFALGCGYLDRAAYLELDARYDAITRQLVRMITQAPRWAPGRASGRTRGAAPETPTSPSPREGRKGQESGPGSKAAAVHPFSPGKAPATESRRQERPAP